jgi:flagellar protein FlaG
VESNVKDFSSRMRKVGVTMDGLPGIPPSAPLAVDPASVERINNSTKVHERVSTGNNTDSPSSQTDKNISDQDITRTLERVKKALKESNTKVELEWNKEIDRVVMKVIDNSTGEIVKQIPPQNVIDREVEFMRLIGLLFDHKA